MRGRAEARQRPSVLTLHTAPLAPRHLLALISKHFFPFFRFGSRAEAAALLAEWIATIALPAGLSPGCARVLAGAVGAPDGRLELELRLASISALEALWAALPAPTHRAWGERLARHIEGSPRWEVFYELPSGGGGSAPTAAATAVASPAREGLPPPPAVSPPPPPPAQPPSVGSAPLTAGGVAVVSAADVDAILAWSDGPGAPAAGSGRARSGDVFIPPPGSPPSFPSQPPPTAVGSRAADDTPFGRSGGDGGASDGDEENLTLGPRPDGSRVVLDWKGDFMIVRPGDNLPGL